MMLAPLRPRQLPSVPYPTDKDIVYEHMKGVLSRTNKAIAEVSTEVMGICSSKGIATIWYRPEAFHVTDRIFIESRRA